MSTSMIWRNTPMDAALVIVSALEAALKIYLVIAFDDLQWPMLLGMVAALVVLNCMNYECAGHYFIHTPFFRSRLLNGAFGVLNSLAFGFPQTLYRAEHLCHHRYGSDYRDPRTGMTQDPSSVYRFGPGGTRPEPIWRYAVLSPFRQDSMSLIRATPRRLRLQLLVEILAVLLLLAWAAWISPWALLTLLFISWAGSAVSHVQNWLKHAHAMPGSTLTDSVSSYGSLYNALWFNNGYHQEHHYRPSTHWRRLPLLKTSMRPESERRVVPHAHFWNITASDRPTVSGGAET